MSLLRLRGLRVLVQLTLDGLRDEPAHFLLMTSRRFASMGTFLALSAKLSRTLSNPVFARNSAALRVLSAIDLLDGNPGKALNRIRDDKSSAGLLAQARIKAFTGDIDVAVELARLAGRRGKRLVEVYSSEVGVLTRPLSKATNAHIFEPKQRRVLHLITNSLPFTNSGYTQRTHSVLKSIREAGWEVLPFTRLGYPWITGSLPSTGSDLIEGIRYRRLLPRRFPASMGLRLDAQSRELVRRARRCRPALLHTTTEYLNGLSVQSAATELGIPWVYEVRGQLADTWLSGNDERSDNSFKYKNFKSQEARVAKSADAVITLGQAMKDELVRAGVDADKILVCPNAVGDEYISDLLGKDKCRERLELGKERLYIGTVSSLVGYEGLDTLLRAFAQLYAEYPEMHLLVVGDGVERQNLIRLSRDLGVSDRAHFPGRVAKEQARMYHQAMDIFVVPRRDLTVTRSVTPLKPVEAMACEVPVIASDLPALREIVTDASDGLLFRPEDAGDLADKIRHLASDPLLRSQMGANGRVKVLQTRTWAGNAKNIVKLYDSLVAQHKR